ncbi:hypothetical protein H4219_006045 [Mycoemilia scoparia]|uniref:Uncharacterized protein n=1 Tax=Mycoemilia scoparia TaxID=417184 RepID=A0A9W7ZK55_9FUNG|nr:hypothetical protein H4219_006045 [Mycoemilia scoparia]
MAFGWRNAGLNYLEYSSVAARALRRVVTKEVAPKVARRDAMALKFSKWSEGKAGELKPAPVAGVKADQGTSA